MDSNEKFNEIFQNWESKSDSKGILYIDIWKVEHNKRYIRIDPITVVIDAEFYGIIYTNYDINIKKWKCSILECKSSHFKSFVEVKHLWLRVVNEMRCFRSFKKVEITSLSEKFRRR